MLCFTFKCTWCTLISLLHWITLLLRIKARDYGTSIKTDDNEELHIQVDASMDTTYMEVEPSGQWCDGSDDNCRKVDELWMHL